MGRGMCCMKGMVCVVCSMSYGYMCVRVYICACVCRYV